MTELEVVLLESESQPHLYSARIAGTVHGVAIVHGQGGDTEGAVKQGLTARRPVVPAIGEVEEFGAELRVHPLIKSEVLGYGEIPFAERRAGDLIPMHVADGSESRRNDHRFTCHVAAESSQRRQAAAARHTGIGRLRGGCRSARLRNAGAAEIRNGCRTAKNFTEVVCVPIQVPVVALEWNDVAGA